jgi:hypothetical protein
MSIIWNPSEYSDEENLQLSWLRAIEWGNWPLFITQPIAPILIVFFEWWKIAIIITICNYLWSLLRYKYVSVFLADLGSLFIHLKWPASISVAIYFIIQKNYHSAIFSGLWPIITLILLIFAPRTQIGKLQNIIMKKIGYERKDEI